MHHIIWYTQIGPSVPYKMSAVDRNISVDFFHLDPAKLAT